MRNQMLVCAGLAVIAGIVSVGLWQKLRIDERSAALEQVQTGDRGAGSVLPAQPVVTAPPAGKRELLAPPARGNPAMPQINRILAEDAALAKDAGYRKAMAAGTRMTMPQQYPGLVEELGLTPEEAGELFDLLAAIQSERIIANMSVRASGLPADLSPGNVAAIEELMRTQQQIKRRRDESLVALLGSARHAQFKAYEDERPARNRVTALGATLASAGQPLSDAQRRPLTAIFVAEEKRRQEFSQQQISERRPGDPVDPLQIDAANLQFQEQSNRRLLEAAQSRLNAQQLDILKAALDQPLDRSRAVLRVRREQDGQQQ